MDYIINTPCGQLQGYPGRISGTAAYKGIRYATAGRWEYPRQVTSWEGLYDATQYGSCSYQPRACGGIADALICGSAGKPACSALQLAAGSRYDIIHRFSLKFTIPNYK